MSKSYTITLSDAQDKALSVIAYSQQEWIESAVFERCRLSIEEIVAAEVQRLLAAGQPVTGTKEEIVIAADIETSKKRHERFAAAGLPE
jgi:hypothetical protein